MGFVFFPLSSASVPHDKEKQFSLVSCHKYTEKFARLVTNKIEIKQILYQNLCNRGVLVYKWQTTICNLSHACAILLVLMVQDFDNEEKYYITWYLKHFSWTYDILIYYLFVIFLIYFYFPIFSWI